MIPRLPNFTLSRIVGLCCLTGAVFMTAACSDSTSKYSPTSEIPPTVDLSSSSSSSSSSGSSSGGPVIIEVDMESGWRVNPTDLNWDYAAGGVWYEPTAGQHQLVTDLTTPRNFNGAKLSYTVEVDSAFVESGSNLQVLFQQKSEGYPGYWDCTIEAEALADGEETFECTLPETGWNLEHSSGVQIGVQTPGEQEAEPAGIATILGITLTVQGTTPPPPAVNLLSDGGFEGLVPESGWNGTWAGGSISLSTDQAFEGNKSLRISNRDEPAAGGQINLTTRVTPGTTYNIKAMAKHTNTVKDVLKINAKVQCSGEDATYPFVAEHAEAPVDNWTALEGQLTLPDCAFTEVLVYFENTAAGMDIFVDNMSVMAGQPIVNLVTDGGFEGETLTGWSGWADGVPSLSTDEKVSGLQSLLISERATDAAGAAYAVTSGVASDTTYRVTAMAKHMGAGPNLLKINAKIRCDGADTYPAVAQVDAAAADTWTKLEGDLVIPACTTVGEALIYFESTAAGVDIYVDNVMVVVAPEPDSEPQNLVLNGDFETDTTGWDAFGSTAVLSASDAEAHSGTQSLLATGRTGTGGFAGYDLTDEVSRGKTYAVTAWAMHKGAGADALRVASVVNCTPETAPAEHNSFPWINNVAAAPANTWTQLSGNLMVADCELTEVKLYFEGTAGGVDVYIDHVSFIEVGG